MAGRESLRDVSAHSPVVAFVQITLADLGISEFQEQIKTLSLQPKLVVCAGTSRIPDAIRAVNNGAFEILVDSNMIEKIQQAIVRAYRSVHLKLRNRSGCRRSLLRNIELQFRTRCELRDLVNYCACGVHHRRMIRRRKISVVVAPTSRNKTTAKPFNGTGRPVPPVKLQQRTNACSTLLPETTSLF